MFSKKHTCDDCGKPCGKESNLCARCSSPPTPRRSAIFPLTIHSPPPLLQNTGQAPQVTGQARNPGRYKRGERLQITDPFSMQYFNDMCEYIEKLEDRVVKLELLTKTPCADCEGYAMDGDYLCQTCRAR